MPIHCFLFLSCPITDALPLQHLPPKPGFVPVFIRYGDEPLETINPALAVAFGEAGFEGRNIKDDDIDGHMLADEPVPIPAPKFDGKKATAKVEEKKDESDVKQELEERVIGGEIEEKTETTTSPKTGEVVNKSEESAKNSKSLEDENSSEVKKEETSETKKEASAETKKEDAKPDETKPVPEESSSNQSDSNESGPQEEPKALPIQKEGDTKVEKAD